MRKAAEQRSRARQTAVCAAAAAAATCRRRKRPAHLLPQLRTARCTALAAAPCAAVRPAGGPPGGRWQAARAGAGAAGRAQPLARSSWPSWWCVECGTSEIGLFSVAPAVPGLVGLVSRVWRAWRRYCGFPGAPAGSRSQVGTRWQNPGRLSQGRAVNSHGSTGVSPPALLPMRVPCSLHSAACWLLTACLSSLSSLDRPQWRAPRRRSRRHWGLPTPPQPLRRPRGPLTSCTPSPAATWRLWRASWLRRSPGRLWSTLA